MVEVHKAFERFQIMIEEFASSVPPLGRGLCGQRAAVMFKIELPHPSRQPFPPRYVLLKPVKIIAGELELHLWAAFNAHMHPPASL